MNRLATVAAVAAATVLSTTAGASAATGDATLGTDGSYNIEMKTNQCAGASSYTHVDDLGTWAYVNGAYSSCVTRVRLKYVSNGTAHFTNYAYAYGNQTNLASVSAPAVRCYTEVGVRRNDGTYYTRSLLNPNRPNGCGV